MTRSVIYIFNNEGVVKSVGSCANCHSYSQHQNFVSNHVCSQLVLYQFSPMMQRYLQSLVVFLLLVHSVESSDSVGRQDDKPFKRRESREGPRQQQRRRLRRQERRLNDDDNGPVSNAGIVGGDDADLVRYPYFTLFDGEYLGLDGLFSCAAVLIHDDILLSAAHCGIDLLDAYAYVNYTQTFEIVGFSGYEFESVVDDWAMHPDYVRETRFNDIMLLKLANATPSTYVPVPYNANPAIPVDDDPVRVLGIGVLRHNSNFYPTVLQQGDVHVVNHEDCNDENSYNGRVNDDLMICAGREGGGVVSAFFSSALLLEIKRHCPSKQTAPNTFFLFW